jgi:hypothetical protein
VLTLLGFGLVEFLRDELRVTNMFQNQCFGPEHIFSRLWFVPILIQGIELLAVDLGC